MGGPDGYVLQLIEYVGLEPPTPVLQRLARGHEGRYLVRFDPGHREPLHRIVTSTKVSLAHVFSTAADALAYWSQTDPYRPVRPDGKPNRPLTAYTMEVVPVKSVEIATS